MKSKIKISIIGVTGYTGLELLRLAISHPSIEIVHLVSRQDEPVPLCDLYPAFKGMLDTHMVGNVPLETVAADSDVVFLALPHTASQPVAQQLFGKTRIIDLGADFRLSDTKTYEAYYGSPHSAPDLLAKSVYGFPEHNKDSIKNAELVANPGCYALLIQLILLPFAGHINNVSVTAVTGSTGFGKTPNDLSHHPVHHDNMQSYKINTHRHTPEITRTAKITEDQLNIVPTLGPFARGIFATAFIDANSNIDAIRNTYGQETPFVRMQDTVTLSNIIGSNYCDLHYQSGHQNHIIAQGALDNLTKGSSGNAIQCMNIMFGLNETLGLDKAPPLFP